MKILRCEDEKLHLSGAIQSYGALIGLDPKTFQIIYASDNLESFIGLRPQDIIGKPASQLPWLQLKDLNFSENPNAIVNIVDLNSTVNSSVNSNTNLNCSIDARIILGNNCILIELEQRSIKEEFIFIQDYIKSVGTISKNEIDQQLQNNQLAAGIQFITKCDRVLLYKFHEDWTGEVLTEVKSEGLESYLGLRFPASDIPANARNLYLLNAYRMIPDIYALPASVIGIDSLPPDLSNSDLRSVSPIHIQYLKNMGVKASFSVPVRYANQLWGLIACHHMSKKYLTAEQRNKCVNLANSYSRSFFNYNTGCKLRFIDSLERQINKIIYELKDHSTFAEAFSIIDIELLSLLDATGFAAVSNTESHTVGEVPQEAQLAALDLWFQKECSESLFISDNLSSKLPIGLLNSDLIPKISGMIAILKSRTPLDKSSFRFYWFRPEEIKEVTWAGNPDKPLSENQEVTSLSPRKSFEKWVEVKKGYSRPWDSNSKLIATQFRKSLYQT